MNAKVNAQEILEWSDSVGGVSAGAVLVVKALECSISKGEKIAAGRYLSGLSPLEQRALLELTKRPKGKLLIPLARVRRSAS